MLDDNLRFKATDELALINAISMTEVGAKKCQLYAGLSSDNEVRDFFQKRSMFMKRVVDDLRKELDRIGGS
ncbi:hypothetical protein [Dethiobacter alkaliphilus]|uniref:hypothetical protein n=1 Tax=Dethiobacter alkaliphilus TaxID=427926 RepID=UPI002227B315|nr:hypothetical protein [Dethiobacter alkaliphilus]MCW3489509.1 hypothetical protein [Dethiobacter alkaliphilus]